MQWIALATEDELSEAVGIRLIREVGLPLEVGRLLRKGGFGYLHSRLQSFCQLAQHEPVLLITDLDRRPCAAHLIMEWLGRIPRPHRLLLRVAVREIESWLLADHEAMKTLLGSGANLPQHADTLADPKRTLLDLAKRAEREVRADLRAEPGVVAAQGLGYNRRMSEFVRQVWSPRRASARSRSLSRARCRLRELADGIAGASR